MSVRYVLVAAGCAALALAGCREERKPGESELYDPDLDGPPHIATLPPPPDAATADLEAPSETGATGAPAGPGSRQPANGDEPPKPPPGAGVSLSDLPAGARDVLRDMEKRMSRAQGDQVGQALEGLASAFVDRDAQTLRSLGQLVTEVEAEEKRTNALLQQRLGTSLPKRIQTGEHSSVSLGFEGAGAGGMGIAGEAKLEDLQFVQQGPDRYRVDAAQMKGLLALVRQGGTWKLEFGDAMREMVPVVEDMVRPSRAFLQQVRQGVENGSITKANRNERLAAIAKTSLGPAMERAFGRMMQVMMKHANMGGGMEMPVPPLN